MLNRREAVSAGEALVPARGRRVTPHAMNKRMGWEDEATTRAINAQPWEPPPGMVKRQCPDCRYWFAAPVNRAALEPRCVDCAEKLPRGRRR